MCHQTRSARNLHHVPGCNLVFQRNSCCPIIGLVHQLPCSLFFSAVIFPVYLPIAAIIIFSIFELLSTSTVNLSDMHVPASYASNTIIPAQSYFFFGITFGGIEWNFIYPTRFEQTLWRITLTTISILAFLLPKEQQDPNTTSHTDQRSEQEDRSEKDFVFNFISFRSQTKLWRLELLIGQAVALLTRTQLPDAFLEIDWTRYIPHI